MVTIGEEVSGVGKCLNHGLPRIKGFHGWGDLRLQDVVAIRNSVVAAQCLRTTYFFFRLDVAVPGEKVKK